LCPNKRNLNPDGLRRIPMPNLTELLENATPRPWGHHHPQAANPDQLGANHAITIHAVNNLEELVEALEGLHKAVGETGWQCNAPTPTAREERITLLNNARAVLRAAKGEDDEQIATD
jgi:hypothetical protein